MEEHQEKKSRRKFEDTLLIVKPDYMHKRKNILLYLQQCEFQMLARRTVLFTPEHAAEFYKNSTDEKLFMLQVILLSKGNSEAFIFTGENGVEALRNTMICYFRSTIEMERHVHCTQTPEEVQHEITFIFPNYIHEPIPYYDRDKFCLQPFVRPLMNEIYNILDKSACEPNVNWKLRLAEHLNNTNPNLPQVSNECCVKPYVGLTEKSQQTSKTMVKQKSKPEPESPKLSETPPCMSSSRSSRLLSTTSCISCGGFSSEKPDYPCADFFTGQVQPLDLTPRVSVHTIVEEQELPVEEEAVALLTDLIEATVEQEGSLSTQDSDYQLENMFASPAPSPVYDDEPAPEEATEAAAEPAAEPPAEAAPESAAEPAPEAAAEPAPEAAAEG